MITAGWSPRPFIQALGLTAALVLFASSAVAAPRDRENTRWWQPSTFFVQAGTGDADTYAYTVGTTWDWNWQRQTKFGRMTGYTEIAVGRWQYDRPETSSSRQWFTQVGATPVIRLFHAFGDGRWFTEIGIGANYIAPVYITDRKTFSTRFNFGDHAAFGRVLDNEGRSAIALRIQHFSNAGIDAPNPGENFGQLRFSYQY